MVLSGAVRSRGEHDEVAAAAWSVPGVTVVEDRILVDRRWDRQYGRVGGYPAPSWHRAVRRRGDGQDKGEILTRNSDVRASVAPELGDR